MRPLLMIEIVTYARGDNPTQRARNLADLLEFQARMIRMSLVIPPVGFKQHIPANGDFEVIKVKEFK